MKCQTQRTECTNQAAWTVVLSCCKHTVKVCDQHAQEGMEEWNKMLVRLGISEYQCGECNRAPMPRPNWWKDI